MRVTALFACLALTAAAPALRAPLPTLTPAQAISQAAAASPDRPRAPPAKAMSESSSRATTLVDVEREHIVKVLHETKWVVGGPNGAAVRLGVNRTTLNHRMRKLGITRPQPQ